MGLTIKKIRNTIWNEIKCPYSSKNDKKMLKSPISQNTIFKRDCENHKILQLLVGEIPHQLLAGDISLSSKTVSETPLDCRSYLAYRANQNVYNRQRLWSSHRAHRIMPNCHDKMVPHRRLYSVANIWAACPLMSWPVIIYQPLPYRDRNVRRPTR